VIAPWLSEVVALARLGSSSAVYWSCLSRSSDADRAAPDTVGTAAVAQRAAAQQVVAARAPAAAAAPLATSAVAALRAPLA
jgi:hypothetical protein